MFQNLMRRIRKMLSVLTAAAVVLGTMAFVPVGVALAADATISSVVATNGTLTINMSEPGKPNSEEFSATIKVGDNEPQPLSLKNYDVSSSYQSILVFDFDKIPATTAGMSATVTVQLNGGAGVQSAPFDITRLSITDVTVSENADYKGMKILGWQVQVDLDADGSGQSVGSTSNIRIELYRDDTLLGFEEWKNWDNTDLTTPRGSIDVAGDYESSSWDFTWSGEIDDIPNKAVATVEYTDERTVTTEMSVDLSYYAPRFEAADAVYALFEDVDAQPLVLAEGVMRDQITQASALVEALEPEGWDPIPFKVVFQDLIMDAYALIPETVNDMDGLLAALDDVSILLIYLQDGDYKVPYPYEGAADRPQLQIERPVTLIASNPGEAKIIGNAVEIMADNVTLDGLVIEATDTDNALATVGGQAVDGLELRNLSVNGVVGLSIKNSGSVEIDGVEITAEGDQNKLWLSGPTWGPLNDVTVNGETDPSKLEQAILGPNSVTAVELHLASPKAIYVNSESGRDSNLGSTSTTAKKTIQAAVDAAFDGDTIQVGPGTYAENLSLDKHVSIIGDPNGGTKLGPAADKPVITLAASGVSHSNPLLLKNLHIQTSNSGGHDYGKMTGIMIQGDETKLAYIKLDNVSVTGNEHVYKGNHFEYGLHIRQGVELSDLVIKDSSFSDLSYGMFVGQIASGNPGFLDGVEISDTIFEGNSNKGMYVEKLSNATLTNVSFIGNGIPSRLEHALTKPHAAGLDINLKYGEYENITLNNLTVTGNGLGAKEGVGVAIKARDDGDYGVVAASLTNVTINGGTFSGNERGLRIGEPGKNNAGPTNVTVHGVAFTNNVKTYGGTDGSAYGALINVTKAETTDVTRNWWGASSGPAEGQVIGTTVIDPWYINPGRTVLSDAVEEDGSVDATEDDFDVADETSGEAALPDTVSTVRLSNNTVLNLSNNTKDVGGGDLGEYVGGDLGGKDLSGQQSVGGMEVEIRQTVKLKSGDGEPIKISNQDRSNVELEIPNETTVLAPDNWDGKLTPPKTGTGGGNAPSGFSVGDSVIEVGSPNAVLLFDKPVTLTLQGVTGPVGYRPAGSDTWTRITTYCGGNYDSPFAPVFPGECFISNGTDTKIVTYHLTSFGALARVSSGGGASAKQPEEPEAPVTLGSESKQVQPGERTTVTATSGERSLTVTIPAGAMTGQGTITVAPLAEDAQPAEGAGLVKIGSQIYEILMEDGAGNPVRSFDEPLSLTFEYDRDDLPEGLVEEDLQIFYWDEGLESWILVPSERNQVAGTVTARVDHLTVFALMAAPELTIPNDIQRQWFEADVLKLISLGVVSGYGDGTFRPGRTVTRAEFTKLLVEAVGLTPASSPELAFDDADTVPEWAVGYVATAVQAGLIQGFEDNTFRAGENVTREQVAVLVARAGALQGQTSLRFTDAGSIASWAEASVSAAVAAGIITGFEDNTFRPQATATRAQAAVMIARLIDLQAR